MWPGTDRKPQAGLPLVNLVDRARGILKPLDAGGLPIHAGNAGNGFRQGLLHGHHVMAIGMEKGFLSVMMPTWPFQKTRSPRRRPSRSLIIRCRPSCASCMSVSRGAGDPAGLERGLHQAGTIQALGRLAAPVVGHIKKSFGHRSQSPAQIHPAVSRASKIHIGQLRASRTSRRFRRSRVAHSWAGWLEPAI